MDKPPPQALTLARLPDEPGAAHAEARRFCLAVIKEFYGFDHRPDWHADLDALLLSAGSNHYSAAHRGVFWTLAEADGSLIATAAIRGLVWKPAIAAAFAERYPEPGKVASVWRVYVRKDRRGHGLGTWLNALAEDEARRLGYDRMYLHATTGAAATIAFWARAGYGAFAADAETTHFDKRLG
jgi:GNAT superfamily N-acetyltransferase